MHRLAAALLVLATPASGHLRVVVVGSFAPVAVDGRPVGFSPLELRLPAGPHRVELLETPGTYPQARTITVPADAEAVFTPAWKPSWLHSAHPLSVDDRRVPNPAPIDRFGALHVTVHRPAGPVRVRLERCLAAPCLLPGEHRNVGDSPAIPAP